MAPRPCASASITEPPSSAKATTSERRSTSPRASQRVATGGEVLLTAHTAALAPELDGVFYEPRGREALRNVREPVELFAAVRTGEALRAELPIDPVCRMAVDPDRAAGRLMHEGTAYFFCTLTCAGEFARAPDRYVVSS